MGAAAKPNCYCRFEKIALRYYQTQFAGSISILRTVYRRGTMLAAVTFFVHQPALQPFNSDSTLGSSANFASAVSMVKYSNPQEGPR